MSKFMTGVMIGGMLTVASAAYSVMNKRQKREVVKTGRKMMKRASKVVDDWM